MDYIDTATLARLNGEMGGHWYEPDTMRFFSSHVSRLAYLDESGAFAFFVSSERFSDDVARLYTVRVAHLTDGHGPRTTRGGVDTVGEFQQYATRASADRAARALAADPSDYVAGLAIDDAREAAQA